MKIFYFMLSGSEYYEVIRAAFVDRADANVAQQQVRYMKQHFDFLGMKAPIWTGVLKDLFAGHGKLLGGDLQEFIECCFDDDRRELQYAAIEMVQQQLKLQDEGFIEVLEYMIVTKSWWDSVDWLAKLVGMHFRRFPQLIEPTTVRWMASEELWLQRVCIIFQLFYKEKTDTALLSKYILMVVGSKEFFLQKASGWALRHYSRTNPQFVVDFVAAHPELSNLAKKEALRLLKPKTA